VDVRTRADYESGHLDQAHHIPVDELRERFHELDPGRKTVVYCKVGLRGYIAARILQQSGFNEVYNLTGGILSCPKRHETLSIPRNGNETVSVQALRELIGRESSVAVDVREADEYEYEHIDGTLNFPQSRLGGMLDQLPRDKEIYVFCATGARSAQSFKTLKAGGFVNAHGVEGGLAAWKRLGYPVIRRKGPIPIMRQVQIVSGSLALIGGLVSPLRWIAVIVGCGLIFAGTTGICGMARLLSKLPWNRVDRSSGSRPPCNPTCA
jgi:rhodanese-related sulfurtransferase